MVVIISMHPHPGIHHTCTCTQPLLQEEENHIGNGQQDTSKASADQASLVG